MSKCGEAALEQDNMEEYIMMEEMTFHNAVHEVAVFIESGAVTMEQVEQLLRESCNV